LEVSDILKQEDIWRECSDKQHILMHKLIPTVNRILVLVDMDALFAQASNLAPPNPTEALARGATEKDRHPMAIFVE
jgi:hypothetical protein